MIQTVQSAAEALAAGAGGMYHCDICGYDTRHASNFYAHRRLHTGQRYNCSYCSKSYSQKQSLKHHLERTHRATPLSPLVANGQLDSKLSDNLSPDVMKILGTMITPVRDVSSPQQAAKNVNTTAPTPNLRGHVKLPTQQRNKQPLSPHSLDLSQRSSHFSDMPRLNCTYTPASPNTYMEWDNLRQGQFQPPAPPTPPLSTSSESCDGASETAGSYAARDIICRYLCTSCGSHFAGMTELEVHCAMHEAEHGKFPCGTCGILFAAATDFAEHTELVHGSISRAANRRKNYVPRHVEY